MALVEVGNPPGGVPGQGAQPTFATQGEFLQYLNGQPTPQVEKDLTSAPGAQPLPVPGAQGVTGGTTTQATGTEQRDVAASPVNFGQTGNAIDRILSPFQNELPKAYGDIQNTGNTFRQAAGPSRTYSTIQGEQTLRGALDPYASSEQLQGARGLIGAEYGGPQGLDTTETARIGDILNQFGTVTDAAQSGSGLYGLLRQAVPGLTGGQAKAEAQRLIRDQGYLDKIRPLAPGVEYARNALDTERSGAEAFAKQRQGEEQGIADQSRQFLMGERAGIVDPLTQEAQRLNTEQERRRAAVAKLADTGSIADLQALGKDAMSFDPNAFNTQAQQTTESGKAAREKILGEFQDVKALPFLTKGSDLRGRENWVLPEDFQGDKPNEATMERLLARQKALVEAGFSPYAENYQKPGFTSQSEAPGQYGAFLPVFGPGGDFQPLDYRPYLSTSGMEQVADLESLSGTDQEQRFNRINDLLGEATRLEANGRTFEAGMVGADVDKFLKDEEAVLAERGEATTEADKEYRQGIKHLRKRYKKAQEVEKWAKVARVINNVALFSVLGPAGPGLYEGERSQGSGSGGGKKSTASKSEQAEGKLFASILG